MDMTISDETILALESPQATLDQTGGKGASLARLAAAGLPVPDGFHITTAAYRQFIRENDLQPAIQAALADIDLGRPSSLEHAEQRIRALFAQAETPAAVAGIVREAYSSLPGENPAVAVRSSATAEDLPEASFAGQQETYLNLDAPEEVLEAVKRCWGSLWTARAIGYRMHSQIDQDQVSLAVVVQLLVPAEAAGILFTANPINGRRDQVVINAAWGLGEAVVGGAVTPDTLTVEKQTGKVIERQIADKQVMTVRVNGGTQEQPVPEELRRTAVLEDPAAAELAHLGVEIEALYGMPMDIEWALAGGKLYILQARPITALPELQVEPPVDWPVPSPRARYLRNNIVELMPNPLTPLFATLGLKGINRVMKRTMAGYLGEGILPDRLIITINGYAYYNGEFTLRQIGRILWSSIGVMRRMFTGIEERWQEARARYFAAAERWDAAQPDQLSAAELVGAADENLEAAIEYYTAIVSGLVPAAWISEGIFSAVYDRLIRRKRGPHPDPLASIYLLGYESKPVQAEKALFDLAQWAAEQPGLAEYLTDTPSRRLAEQLNDESAPEDIVPNTWHTWKQRFQAHLRQYGGMIYDLDFVQPTPAGEPGPILETFKLFLRGEGANPHTRQQAAAARREAAVQATADRLGRLRGRLFRSTLQRAQKYAPRREDGLAELGTAYPHLRRMLLELGSRFARAGAIETTEDIFWLEEKETLRAAAALDREKPTGRFTGQVAQRKAEWQARNRVVPPVALPQRKKLAGISPDQFGLSRTAQSGEVLKGTPCSPGKVTGPARVLRGPQDFDQMRPGEVLIAAITTPAWTPLFAMASAIVTDIGGPLSHGSIVAREYGIPAVLGTGVATRLVESGQTVTVDGSRGIVTREKAAAPPEGDQGVEWTLPEPKGRYMRTSVVDFMPNPLSPLFATMGLTSYNRSMQKMMAEIAGSSNTGFPEELVVTIRDYAYYKVNYSARTWWILGVKLAPKIIHLFRRGPAHFRDAAFPAYQEKVRRGSQTPAADMTAAEIWQEAHALLAAAMDHLAILQIDTLGAAAGSEGLFTAIYNRFSKKDGDPEASAFIMGYDTAPIRAEKSLYELAEWGRRQPELTGYLLETDAEAIASALHRSAAPDDVPEPTWSEWKRRLHVHLQAFGYMLYDLDFAKPIPAEDPALQIETIKMYLRGEGTNPYERQGKLARQREQAREQLLGHVRGLRGWALRKALGWAQSVGEVREESIASIGLAYPRLRELLKELGRRMADAGAFADPTGIFWLEGAEVEARLNALDQGKALESLQPVIEQRKEIRQVEEKMLPPAQIPYAKTYMGIPLDSFLPGEGEQEVGQIKGIGASGGRAVGVARVLHGPEDFDQMQPGDILVAKLTTPAWTPLFAMASAIVTDIGGPLSHGSIVAREYGIPAVLGTGMATRLIQNGQTITVDGSQGIVVLSAPEKQGPAAQQPQA